MKNKDILKYGQKLAHYIIDGGLLDTLNIIGDIHVKAAKLSLTDLDQSKDKKRDLILAIGHLQSAHISYKELWDKEYWEDRWSNFKNIYLQAEIYYLDFIVVYEIARCFALLGDEEKVKKYLNIVEKMPATFQKNAYTDSNMDTLIGAAILLSPLNLINSLRKEIFDSEKKQQREIKIQKMVEDIEEKMKEDRNKLLLLSKEHAFLL